MATTYDQLFGSMEITAGTISDIELWFHDGHADAYLKDMPGDYSGLISACLAELFNSGGFTYQGYHPTLNWLGEEWED